MPKVKSIKKSSEDGTRITLYFPKSDEYLLDFINNLDEKRNKIILNLIRDYYSKSEHSVTNEELLNEIQSLKKMLESKIFVTSNSSGIQEIEEELEEETNLLSQFNIDNSECF